MATLPLQTDAMIKHAAELQRVTSERAARELALRQATTGQPAPAPRLSTWDTISAAFGGGRGAPLSIDGGQTSAPVAAPPAGGSKLSQDTSYVGREKDAARPQPEGEAWYDKLATNLSKFVPASINVGTGGGGSSTTTTTSGGGLDGTTLALIGGVVVVGVVIVLASR